MSYVVRLVDPEPGRPKRSKQERTYEIEIPVWYSEDDRDRFWCDLFDFVRGFEPRSSTKPETSV